VPSQQLSDQQAKCAFVVYSMLTPSVSTTRNKLILKDDDECKGFLLVTSDTSCG